MTLLYPFILFISLRRGYWIGMRWEIIQGRHIWTDNDVVTWTIWGRRREPDCMSASTRSIPCSDTEIQNCVRLNMYFKFMTSNCSDLYQVICQRGKLYFYRQFVKFPL